MERLDGNPAGFKVNGVAVEVDVRLTGAVHRVRDLSEAERFLPPHLDL
jgi:hypothetical protein